METRYLLIVKQSGKTKKVLELIQKLMFLTQEHGFSSMKTSCFTRKNFMLVKGFLMFDSLEQMEAFAQDI